MKRRLRLRCCETTVWRRRTKRTDARRLILLDESCVRFAKLDIDTQLTDVKGPIGVVAVLSVGLAVSRHDGV